MLTLIAKVKKPLEFENHDSGYDYLIVIYIDGKRTSVRQPTLNYACQQYPKAHLTSLDKLQAVDAVYKLTESTEDLKEFWESL